MENKTISIILPHYNHTEYLYESVQSIINQTCSNWTLLLINDDPRVDILNYGLLDSRIIVYQDGYNKGQPTRLNEGINYSHSDYIAFQDADDISISQRLELSLKYINGFDAIYSDAVVLFRNGTNKYITSPEPTLKTLETKCFGCFASTMMRTDLAKETLFDESVGYGNDWIWWIKVMKKNPKVRKIPFPLYFYRDYSSNFRLRTVNKFQTIKSRIHKRKMQKILMEQVKNAHKITQI